VTSEGGTELAAFTAEPFTGPELMGRAVHTFRKLRRERRDADRLQVAQGCGGALRRDGAFSSLEGRGEASWPAEALDGRLEFQGVPRKQPCSLDFQPGDRCSNTELEQLEGAARLEGRQLEDLHRPRDPTAATSGSPAGSQLRQRSLLEAMPLHLLLTVHVFSLIQRWA
jgi:hypothetical protein